MAPLMGDTDLREGPHTFATFAPDYSRMIDAQFVAS
jgi:hypothetical protein